MTVSVIARGSMTGGTNPSWNHRHRLASHLVRSEAGRYEVHFEHARRSTNYVVMGSTGGPHGVGATKRTTLGFELLTHSDGAFADPSTPVDFLVIGDA